MSAQAFNRISALERQVRELLERVGKLEIPKTQACEAERPLTHTLSLKSKKADSSHA